MQDPSSLYSQINPQVQQPQPQFPEQEHLKCPRCDSPNTKFCYYNNYNLSQPRHFCKSCKRYWTKGGALRNIPVGGASRKNTKRTSNSNSSTTKRPAPAAPAPPNKSDGKVNGGQMSETLPLMSEGQFGNLMEVSGSFSSMLVEANEGQFGNLIGEQFGGDPGSGSRVGLESGSSGNGGGDGFLNIHQW